jgi:hypothetical protein
MVEIWEFLSGHLEAMNPHGEDVKQSHNDTCWRKWSRMITPCKTCGSEGIIIRHCHLDRHGKLDKTAVVAPEAPAIGSPEHLYL